MSRGPDGTMSRGPAWPHGIRWQVVTAAAVALALMVAALSLALAANSGGRAASTELSGRLVPAASSAVRLVTRYSDQQNALRAYVTAGRAGSLVPYRAMGEAATDEQDALAGLVRGYPGIAAALAATQAAYHAWLTKVAGVMLAVAARGDFGAAQRLQANAGWQRPSVLTLRSAGFALQGQIAGAQRAVTARVIQAQDTVFGALVAMCGVVAVIAVGNVVLAWRKLIRPFAQLRAAADAVASGRYDTRIPVVGPAELAELGRSTELMRTRLVTALTEREQAEGRFRHLFESAPDAMIAVGADGRIVMANGRAGELYGYPADELIGLPGTALLSEASLREMAEGRADHFGTSVQVTARCRDGREFPAEVSIAALPADDDGPLRVAAIRDLSERLAMQAERERLREEAEQERAARRRRQSERLESLGQLVGGVAHDFNNLLNVIQGYADFTAEQVAEIAEEDPRLAPALEDIGQVRAAAQKAARLTRQLLTFARHDVVRPQVLDLNEAVTSAGELLRRTLGEHVELAIESDPGLWRTKADRGQLEQVLVNLAVNARDAMPGGGRLTVDTRNVEVDEAGAAGLGLRPGLAPGRYVRMRVADTGTGMDSATLERIFEPFFTTKPKGHGTGLGLATVYGIVTQAGGGIDVYSEPGLGTTVSVLLPATEEDAVPDGASASPAAVTSGRGETILLAEDEESLREITRRILAGDGYLVLAATSAEDAVRLAAEPDRDIDLLLTDLVMPGMLGTEVAARVRGLRPETPVLLMSGYAQPLLDAQGMAAGEFDLVEKPFTAAALLGRVRQALGGAQVPRPRGVNRL